MKYVVDPGTSAERTYVYTNVADLFVDGTRVNGVTMGTLAPLSVGGHVVDAYWTMTAMHCDGFSRLIDVSCLLAGDNLALSLEFEVTSGNN